MSDAVSLLRSVTHGVSMQWILFGAAVVLLVLVLVLGRRNGVPGFERGTRYGIADIKDFAAKRGAAKFYVSPILVPLDLLLLVVLGVFFCMVSVSAAAAVPGLKAFAWWFAVLPLLYMAFDLAEDISLIRMLTWPDRVTDANVNTTRTLTRFKIVTLMLSAGQVAILWSWARWQSGGA